MDKYSELLDITKKYGQEHLLKYWDVLDGEGRDKLYASIKSVDFEKSFNALSKTGSGAGEDISEDDIRPISVIEKPSENTAEYKAYHDKGIEVIKAGGVIAVTMAGGQGSRLGHEGPKGTFDMGLPTHKSLFELQVDQLSELAKKTGAYVHLFIMTSEINHKGTCDFFEENGYFGYPKDKISFFCQNMIPVFDLNGNMMLAAKDKVVTAADGNGGIFSALISGGVLDSEDGKKAEFVYISQIDNCLARLCDPVFIGCALASGKSCLTKTLMKTGPDEKAGVYCVKNGKPCVIEYTEVSPEMANMSNPDGSFVYGDVNAGIYLFKKSALEKVAGNGLPYHRYIKKVERLDENGILFKPEKPDSVKLEMFLFDIFNYIDDVTAFRIKREDEFAPIKNATGIDSPASARDLYYRRNKIQMNKIAELDGDEMTRVVWQKIKDIVLSSYIDLNTEYYDLGIMSRDSSDDSVTKEAALAIKRLKVGVKCATITPNAQRVTEYGLKKLWRSPNATIREILDGTVFRSPVIVKGIDPMVKGWKKPIVIARHAYGDIYAAVETKAEKGSKAFITLKKDDGTSTEIPVHDFKDTDGIVLGMHNTDKSIASFARSCMNYALSVKQDLWFSAKDTVSKTYDHRFKDIFQEIFDNEFKDRFDEAGITYFYTLIDDAVARVVRSEGGFVWACKNYDGDVFSDMLAACFGSLSMMTSVLVSPDGCFEYEAAHGTIPRHYKRYLNGEATSTNPIATLFAWTGALRKRGELDGNVFLIDFADRTEKATIELVGSGRMTGDLVKLSSCEDKVTLDLDGFLSEVAENIYK
ncbi:MAG: NADP-dependent isocitrate dehydrogenase [Clostridia bacterium]|nr:NADP-dependent isocitrate dehydrogenase [Clostridia bacterium]